MAIITFPQQQGGGGGISALSNYFGASGTFPFAGDQDVTISSNTTWSDSSGQRKVKKLTINAGVTLTISVGSFMIFAEEIVFGSSTSTIDISGPSGAATGTYVGVTHATGATSGAAGNPGRAQGGCGGGMLAVFANKITGNGKFRSNGGNGFINNSTGNDTSGGPGGNSSILGPLLVANPIVSIPTAAQADMFPRFISKLIADGGMFSTGYAGGKGLASGAGAAVRYSSTQAASAIPASALGKRTLITPTTEEILTLVILGFNAGGGGAAGVGSESNGNMAAGGGGGCVAVWVGKTSPTLFTFELNGGIGVAGSYFTGVENLSGASGLSYLTIV